MSLYSTRDRCRLYTAPNLRHHESPIRLRCLSAMSIYTRCARKVFHLHRDYKKLTSNANCSLLVNQSINHLLLTIQRTNVNVTQHNMSRTERLKSTNSCLEKMKINLFKNDIKIRYKDTTQPIDRHKL